ncbi:MAG: hypothetical protein MZV49_00195 [Rhodopseudomonas palustris]|nr:hypothetical protein [Rhodopseudomonas palustris]
MLGSATLIAFIFALFARNAIAQDLSGTYVMTSQGATLTLVLGKMPGEISAGHCPARLGAISRGGV